MRVTEMSHKELLMAAATAYNLPVRQWVAESYPSIEGLLLTNNKIFNPILNPEQAFWLSLELHMSHRREGNTVIVDVPWAGIEPQAVTNTQAPMRALCLAIVQAAAAISAKGLTVNDIPA